MYFESDMPALSQSYFDLLQFYYDYFTKREKVDEIRSQRKERMNLLMLNNSNLIKDNL